MTKTATLLSPALAAKPVNEDFLAEVEIKLIKYSSTNDMFRDPGDMTDEGVKELMQSIREMGVLQPILLRASGSGAFILVAGERRLRACAALGMETIPAFVRIMSEEEAFELQLTENLQRKDVHPMKEARAFKFLQDKHEWTTAELGLRFGKGETYILQRLKLMELLPEIAKDFTAGELTLGQALVIARLQKEDQKQLLEDCKNYDGRINSNRNYYQSVQVLEDYIAENITRELAKAPFDIADAALIPKAGACATCPKRSGAQSQLFADIKEKDRCFDPACFEKKKALGVLAKVKELVEKKPDTIFLESDGYNVEKVPQPIGSYLAGQKIKALKSGNDYHTDSYYSQFKKKISGFMLNGPQAGKTITVYVRGPQTVEKTKTDGSAKKEPAELSAADRKEAIARIKERAKRNEELDEEKIYTRIIEGLEKSPAIKAKTAAKELAIDRILSRWIILQHAGYDKAYISGYDLKGSPAAQLAAIERISDNDFRQITRKIMLKEYSGQAPTVRTAGGQIIWKLAEALGEVPVKEFVSEQSDIKFKREMNANKRIAELSKSDKPKPAKKKSGGGEISIETATSLLDN